MPSDLPHPASRDPNPAGIVAPFHRHHPDGNSSAKPNGPQDCGLSEEYIEKNLWGYLQPFFHTEQKSGFHRDTPCIKFGSGSANEFRLCGERICKTHCIFTWDGETVSLLDVSSYGTLINGNRIGYRDSIILCDGCEIGIGEYRYTYRQVFKSKTSSPIRRGVEAVYSLGRELGHGTFGVVVHAKHRGTKKSYALKIIDKKRAAACGPKAVENLANEIKHLAKLEHRNVCRIFQSFDDHEPARLVLVLEYMEGGDLFTYIQKKYKKGIPEAGTKDIAYQICEGMAYVHSRGITHRDLKPANILLTKDEPPLVKIADFGIAVADDRMGLHKHHDSEQTICGTRNYVAPEVGEDSGYDNRVDSFAVGVIIFTMLVGKNPFIPDTDEKKPRLLRHFQTRQLNLEGLNREDISEHARSVVCAMLDTDPPRRLSMTGVLNHVWLRYFKPYYGTSTAQPLQRSYFALRSSPQLSVRVRPPTEAEIGSDDGEGDRTGRHFYLPVVVPQ